MFLELLSWPLADVDKTLSKSVKERIIRSSSAVDLANGMSPSYSSYATPKRRSPQMAAAARMTPGATYSLRKDSVCSVSSSRCVMAVSHSKKGVCHLSIACHGWDHFQVIFITVSKQSRMLCLKEKKGNWLWESLNFAWRFPFLMLKRMPCCACSFMVFLRSCVMKRFCVCWL